MGWWENAVAWRALAESPLGEMVMFSKLRRIIRIVLFLIFIPVGIGESAGLERFNGRGQQVSPKFTLDRGLAIFRMTHTGERVFAIWLLDNKGNKKELLINFIGRFDGAKAVGIKKSGTYILDIDADGIWTVTVEQ